MSRPSSARRRIDAVSRREYTRLLTYLVRTLGADQLALAEDVAQEAMVKALEHWPYSGVPERPEAWLRRVARNAAIDQLRRAGREISYAAEQDARTYTPARDEDEDLGLLFLSCQPALAETDQVAFCLRVAAGFSNREIAELLLVPEPTLAQRLVRARQRLRASADLMPPREPGRRLATVHRTVYLTFSAGYFPASGAEVIREDVAQGAIDLARRLAASAAGDASSHALAALLCLQGSRLPARAEAPARADGQKQLVLLKNQDRARWDHVLIAAGFQHLDAARGAEQLSRYHLEAAIAATHARARDHDDTDWDLIARLYEQLVAMTESPIVGVSRALALAYAGDARRALETLDGLAESPVLRSYAPYYAARAEICGQLGAREDAAAALAMARQQGTNSAVADHLATRADLIDV